MVRRSRAIQTKSRLREITSERSEKGTNSIDVVKVFRERFPKLDQREIDDLVDLGLMTLAGRVAASNTPDDGQLDIFLTSGYPEFIPVRTKAGNRSEIVRRNAKSVTPREYFSDVLEPSAHGEKVLKPSRRQNFHKCMEEMREKGFLDITVPEYLARGGDN